MITYKVSESTDGQFRDILTTSDKKKALKRFNEHMLKLPVKCIGGFYVSLWEQDKTGMWICILIGEKRAKFSDEPKTPAYVNP